LPLKSIAWQGVSFFMSFKKLNKRSMQSHKKPDFVRALSSGELTGRQSRKHEAHKRLRGSAHGALIA